MSRKYLKKNLLVSEGFKKRRRRNYPKSNEKKRLQNYNFDSKIDNKLINDSKSNISSNLKTIQTTHSISQVDRHEKENKSVKHKYVIIDGNNVGMAHGIKSFSANGLKLAVNFFVNRGHNDVKVLVPRYRRFESKEFEIFDELEAKGFLCFTPSRYLNGKLIVPYDDRFILEAAQYFNAVIVSNDNFCDIKVEKPEWKHLVETNLLQFMFVGDLFLVASDPMGKNGPTLQQFLTKEFNAENLNEQ